MEIDPETRKQLFEQGAKAIGSVSGGLVRELDALLGQNVTWWRFRNAVDITMRADALLKKKGVDPTQLPPKLKDIVPILEYGSLEDDPPLQDMWASLLASTTMHEFRGQVQPKFHELLRQITASEARMLLWLYEGRFMAGDVSYIHTDTKQTHRHLGISQNEATNLALNLMRLGLVRGQERFNGYPSVEAVEMVTLTGLGRLFVERCTLTDE